MAELIEWGYNILSLIFVFVAIGFCIFSHELGHFLAAKMLGLHVDAFSIGFKAIWRRKYRNVEYRIGILPLGGYCEIPQIDATGEEIKAADGTPLPHATALQKIVTALAGPLFNIITGFMLACVIWIWGMPQDSPKMRSITVLEIDKSGPEYAAGLRQGDKITKLNGEKLFCTWSKFTSSLLYTIGEVELTVERNGKVETIRYTPKVNPNAPGKLKREAIAYPFFTPLIPIELTPHPEGAAARGGVLAGDQLIAINGTTVTGYAEYQQLLDSSRGKEMNFSVLRKNRRVELKITPVKVEGAGDEHAYYLFGIRFDKDTPLEVSETIPGSAAERYGILPGDRIIAVNGIKTANNNSVFSMVQELKDKKAELELVRDGKSIKLNFAADKYMPMTINAAVSLRDYPTPWQQFSATLEMSWKALRGIAVGIGNKLGLTEQSSSIGPRHLSGPLGMGITLFDSVRHATLSVGIYFLVVISFALAIFNLLPLPVLDGGHILFGIIESIIRRPLSPKFMKVLYITFASLLIMMMIYVTISDVRRLYDNNLKPAFGSKTEAKK